MTQASGAPVGQSLSADKAGANALVAALKTNVGSASPAMALGNPMTAQPALSDTRAGTTPAYPSMGEMFTGQPNVQSAPAQAPSISMGEAFTGQPNVQPSISATAPATPNVIRTPMANAAQLNGFGAVRANMGNGRTPSELNGWGAVRTPNQLNGWGAYYDPVEVIGEGRSIDFLNTDRVGGFERARQEGFNGFRDRVPFGMASEDMNQLNGFGAIRNPLPKGAVRLPTGQISIPVPPSRPGIPGMDRLGASPTLGRSYGEDSGNEIANINDLIISPSPDRGMTGVYGPLQEMPSPMMPPSTTNSFGGTPQAGAPSGGSGQAANNFMIPPSSASEDEPLPPPAWGGTGNRPYLEKRLPIPDPRKRRMDWWDAMLGGMGGR